MAVKKTASAGFHCTECGWTAPRWIGRCGECQSWGTVVENTTATGIARAQVAPVTPAPERAARPITQIDTTENPRRTTGVGEFDRVLGGGVVPGAVILLSGEPGVGKSTLLLDVAAASARAGRRVLYVSGEESAAQVRMRAERTGALYDDLFLASETDLGVVLGHIDDIRPDLLIVDSVQTVASPLSEGAAGSPSQVREVAASLVRVAKERALPTILVGHVTKDGQVAGPRLLEHLVDVVCHFEGDRQTALRFIRALKNRFGPTDEVGCFEMAGDGIAEVPDPSALFLSRGAPQPGTCVVISLDGRRVIPVEVQALTVPATNGNPRRVVHGVDGARVAMVLALLDKHLGAPMATLDVYVSTVGGARVTEPAADLAIAIAVLGSLQQTTMPPGVAVAGELSLAGEVRPVTQAAQRRQEARRLGYPYVVDERSGTLRGAVDDAKVRSTPRVGEPRPAF